MLPQIHLELKFKNKRSQAFSWIIIAGIILALVIAFSSYYFMQSTKSIQDESLTATRLASDKEIMGNYLENCLEQSVDKMILDKGVLQQDFPYLKKGILQDLRGCVEADEITTRHFMNTIKDINVTNSENTENFAKVQSSLPLILAK